MRISIWVGLALFALSACSKSHSGSELKVRVITGIVPGPEFNRVETDLFRTVDGNEIALDHADADAYFGLPYTRGQIVATFNDAPREDLMVRVRAFTPQGSMLVEQRARFSLTADYTLTVFLDRECIAVACPSPGGSAALSACLAGQCVDPRCNPEDESTHQYCPEIDFCTPTSQCPAVATCAAQTCVSGICIPEQRAAGTVGACAEGLYCDVDAADDGCREVPASTLPLDAGDDQCGKICTVNGNVCAVGYWQCPEGGAPVCTDFVFVAAGQPCADGLICDGRGACGATSDIDGGVPDGSMDGATPDGAPRDMAPDAPSIIMTVTPGGTTPLYVDEVTLSDPQRFQVRLDGTFTTPFTLTITSLDPDVCNVNSDARSNTITSGFLAMDLPVGVNGVNDDILTGTRECRIRFNTRYGTQERVVRILDDEVVQVTLGTDGGVLDYPVRDSIAFEGGAFLSDDGSSVLLPSLATNIVNEYDPYSTCEKRYFDWNRATRRHFEFDRVRTDDFIAPGALIALNRPDVFDWADGNQIIGGLITGSSTVDSETTNYAAMYACRASGSIECAFHDSVLPINDFRITARMRLSGDGSQYAFTRYDEILDRTSVFTGNLTSSPALAFGPESSVNIDESGTPLRNAWLGGVSRTGRYIAFWGFDDDVTPDGGARPTGNARLFVRDTLAAVTYDTGIDSAAGLDSVMSSPVSQVAVDETHHAVYATSALLATTMTVSVVKYDWVADTQTNISEFTGGSPATGMFLTPALSPDERFLTFTVSSTDYLGGSVASGQTAIVDLETGFARYVPRPTALRPDASAIFMGAPVSSDGRFVLYAIDSATDPVGTEVNPRTELYITGGL